MLWTRIILTAVAAVCFYLFFTYDVYEWGREEKLLVVSAKASASENGEIKKAFVIYREMKDNIEVGEPKTVFMETTAYENTKVGDCKIEYDRSAAMYIVFVGGFAALFFLLMSIDANLIGLLDIF